MRIFMFKSEATGELRAFAGDSAGSKLPQQLGPWHAIGVIRPDKDPPHNLLAGRDRKGDRRQRLSAVADQAEKGDRGLSAGSMIPLPVARRRGTKKSASAVKSCRRTHDRASISPGRQGIAEPRLSVPGGVPRRLRSGSPASQQPRRVPVPHQEYAKKPTSAW